MRIIFNVRSFTSKESKNKNNANHEMEGSNDTEPTAVEIFSYKKKYQSKNKREDVRNDDERKQHSANLRIRISTNP